MQDSLSTLNPRRGMTVLTLLLLIIALVIAAIFLLRYLRSRPAAAQLSSASLPHQPLDQLDLTSVIQVVRGDSMDLLRVRPHPAG